MNIVYLLSLSNRLVGVYSSETFAVEATWEYVKTEILFGADAWSDFIYQRRMLHKEFEIEINKLNQLKTALDSKTDISSIEDIRLFVKERLENPTWDKSIKFHAERNISFPGWNNLVNFTITEMALNEQVR